MWVPARGAVMFTAARVTGACELLGMGVLCDLDQQVCFSYVVLREDQEIRR